MACRIFVQWLGTKQASLAPYHVQRLFEEETYTAVEISRDVYIIREYTRGNLQSAVAW